MQGKHKKTGPVGLVETPFFCCCFFKAYYCLFQNILLIPLGKVVSDSGSWVSKRFQSAVRWGDSAGLFSEPRPTKPSEEISVNFPFKTALSINGPSKVKQVQSKFL